MRAPRGSLGRRSPRAGVSPAPHPSPSSWPRQVHSGGLTAPRLSGEAAKALGGQRLVPDRTPRARAVQFGPSRKASWESVFGEKLMFTSPKRLSDGRHRGCRERTGPPAVVSGGSALSPKEKPSWKRSCPGCGRRNESPSKGPCGRRTDAVTEEHVWGREPRPLQPPAAPAKRGCSFEAVGRAADHAAFVTCPHVSSASAPALGRSAASDRTQAGRGLPEAAQ